MPSVWACDIRQREDYGPGSERGVCPRLRLILQALHACNRGTNTFLPVRPEDDVKPGCTRQCLPGSEARNRREEPGPTNSRSSPGPLRRGGKEGPLPVSQILSLRWDPSLEGSWKGLRFGFRRLHATSHFQEKKRVCWKKKTASEGILGIQQFLGNSIWANIIESATLGSGFH